MQFLPVLDILYVFLQTHSLLFSSFQVADLPRPHDCMPMLSGGWLVSVSGNTDRRLEAGREKHWVRTLITIFPSCKVASRYTCIPSLNTLIKAPSLPTLGFPGGNSFIPLQVNAPSFLVLQRPHHSKSAFCSLNLLELPSFQGHLFPFGTLMMPNKTTDYVQLCQGCHNNAPQIAWLKLQEFRFLNSRLEVQDQGIDRPDYF